MRRLAVLIVVLAVAAGTTGAARAAIFNVTSTVDEPSGTAYDCVTGSFCSLRSAIQYANATPGIDDIYVPAGVYVLTHTGPGEDDAATGDLDVTENVSFHGFGVGSTGTIVDGNRTDRVFDIAPVPTTTAPVAAFINGMTIRAGATTGSGGGIQSFGHLFLSDVRVTDNSATTDFSVGGGIHIGTAVVGTGTIRGSLVAQFLTVDHNVAASGAGIAIDSDDDATIRRSTIDHNTAFPSAGGLGDGGGIKNGGHLTIENSTIANNVAKSAGGALSNFNTASLTNVTIGANGALGAGSAIWNDEAPGTVSISSTVFSNVSAGNECGGPIASLGHNVDPSSTCISPAAAGDVAADPLLQPLGPYGGPTQTMALSPGSPAIDAGNDAACPPLDQRGVVRPQGPHCDSGAYERVPTVIIRISGLLHVIDQLRTSICERRPECKLPLLRGGVRIFPPDPTTLPADLYEKGQMLGECTTDKAGQCTVEVPGGPSASFTAVLKYSDPQTQQTVYLSQTVGPGDPATFQVHMQIRKDGSVRLF